MKVIKIIPLPEFDSDMGDRTVGVKISAHSAIKLENGICS